MNNEEFEEFIAPHLAFLNSHAMQYTKYNKHRAEDLMQETLTKAFKYSNNFDGKYARAWLKRIMRNAYLDFYSELQKKPFNHANSETFEVTEITNGRAEYAEDSSEEEFFNSTYSPEVKNALRILPKQFLDVIILHVEGYSIKEISSMLGIPTGSVSSRTNRAKEKLREALTK